MSLPIFSLILLRRIAKVFVPKPILTLTDSKNGLWGLQSIKVWEHLLCNFSPQIHFHQTFPLFIHCLDVVFYQSKAYRNITEFLLLEVLKWYFRANWHWGLKFPTHYISENDINNFNIHLWPSIKTDKGQCCLILANKKLIRQNFCKSMFFSTSQDWLWSVQTLLKNWLNWLNLHFFTVPFKAVDFVAFSAE